jgi:hypothetical protein
MSDTTNPETSTSTFRWTLKLADATLVHETLRRAAEDAASSADYLEGDHYAEQQRAARKAKPKEEQGPPWKLSEFDLKRIAEYRSKAARLQALADS